MRSILIAAVVLAAPPAAAQAVDQWGLTADDWSRLSNADLREKADYERREDEIDAAASNGDPYAMTLMAGAIMAGVASSQDRSLARTYAKKASEAGIKRAMLTQATLDLMPGSPANAHAQAMQSINAIAQAGFAPAMGVLAVLYANGTAGPIDAARSADWAKRGAAADDVAAIYMLAVHYWQGAPGMPKDRLRANTLLKMAAERGYADAMFWYGILFDEAQLASPDHVTSTKWVGRAAAKGMADAIYYYALRLQQGYGIAKDKRAAISWFRKAADTGDIRAQLDLCAMLGADADIANDVVAASKLCRQVIENPRASQDQIAQAWFNFGVFTERTGDMTAARPFFAKAQALGNSGAAAVVASIDRTLAEASAIEDHRQAAAVANHRDQMERAAQLSSASHGGGPSMNEIADALARSSVRYFGGSLTGSPGEQAYPSPFGGVAYYIRRSIFGINCTRLAPTSYRCEYNSNKQQVPATDSWFGAFATMGAAMTGANGSRHWVDTFNKNTSGWASPTLDATNAELALYAQKQSRETSRLSSSSSDLQRQNKARSDCRGQAMQWGAVSPGYGSFAGSFC